MGLFRRISGYLPYRKLDLLLVFSLVLTGFLFYLLIFQKSGLIPGVDGPYYLIQVESILGGRGLVYGDPPLAFYLLSMFAYITGDVSAGVKIGVSFLCSVAAVPAYFLARRLGRGYLTGVLAGLLVVFSAPFIRMMTDFMKNAIGICWLFSFIYFLHDLTTPGHRRSSLALASLFLVLAGLTHVLVFGVAILYLVIFTGLVILRGGERSFLRASAPLFLVLAAFVVIASVFFAPLFTDFGKVFSFIDDMGESQDAPQPSTVAGGPQPNPRPQRPDLVDSGGLFSLPVVGGWGVVALVVGLGAVISFVEWGRGDPQGQLVVPVTTIVSTIIFLPIIPGEWLSRFILLMVIPTSIILSSVISGEWISGKMRGDLVSLSPLLATVCVSFFAVQAVIFSLSVNPTISNEAHSDLINMGDIIPEGSLVIAPRQHEIGYWVEYMVGADVLGQGESLSPGLWDSYDKVMGIFFRNQVPRGVTEIVLQGRELVLVELEDDEFARNELPASPGFLPSAQGPAN